MVNIEGYERCYNSFPESEKATSRHKADQDTTTDDIVYGVVIEDFTPRHITWST
jgi:hypothetical protein